MKKLYLDCDGVILDTVSKELYQKLADLGIDNENKIREYFSNLDWDEFIIECGQIDNSCDKIKELCNHFDLEILTHVNSEKEGNSKINYFNKVLPMVNVITVPKSIEKADFIKPNGAILVDDYLPNLEYWNKNGGISVKFSNSGKECDFYLITDLLELLNINFENDKKMIK